MAKKKDESAGRPPSTGSFKRTPVARALTPAEQKLLQEYAYTLLHTLRDVTVWQKTYDEGSCSSGDLEESRADAAELLEHLKGIP